MTERTANESNKARQVVLALVPLLLLSWSGDQAIVENYVGRQIPTAMVARNLERGSGFLRPTLDTGPFPNLFLVEPPIYAELVLAVRRISGWRLERCGRMVSAGGISLACWGLFGLVRRRHGTTSATVASLSLTLFPVTLRYGRAFQPDALLVGFWFAGLRAWDDHEAAGGEWRRVLAWCLVAAGLAVKIVWAGWLIVLITGILGARRLSKVLLVCSTLIPALLWYGYAFWMLRVGGGSRASADNAEQWQRALSLAAWIKPATYAMVAQAVAYRAFTPLPLILIGWGLARAKRVDRWWIAGLGASLGTLFLLGGKLHHDYYWLPLAPWVAAGCGVGLEEIFRATARPWVDRIARVVVAVVAIGSTVVVFRTFFATRTTPTEWAAWPALVDTIHQAAPADAWLVAPEAILFLADRRGCRLEFEPNAAERAAGEWGGRIDGAAPGALLAFYRGRGARYVADLVAADDPPARKALHAAIRGGYKVVVDRDGVLLADLTVRTEVPPCPPPPPNPL